MTNTRMICGAENSMLEARPYTDAEFQAIIRKQKKGGFLCSLMKLAKDKETHCPPVTDTEAWIKYLGLYYRTPADCRRVTAKRIKNRNYEKALWARRTRCVERHCASVVQPAAAAQKQLDRSIIKKCSKLKKLTRRSLQKYLECASQVNRTVVHATEEAADACKMKHCTAQQKAISNYMNNPLPKRFVVEPPT